VWPGILKVPSWLKLLLIVAMDEEMYTRVGHKVFVVNAGAHLWMTSEHAGRDHPKLCSTVCQFRYQD
jgi:hypothetical protein